MYSEVFFSFFCFVCRLMIVKGVIGNWQVVISTFQLLLSTYCLGSGWLKQSGAMFICQWKKKRCGNPCYIIIENKIKRRIDWQINNSLHFFLYRRLRRRFFLFMFFDRFHHMAFSIAMKCGSVFVDAICFCDKLLVQWIACKNNHTIQGLNQDGKAEKYD